MFSAKSLAENAASRSEGFLGQYAEKYSAATKEQFWDDAIKAQRKVNKLKIPSAEKVKEIARALKLKWAVPIGTTATLLTKVGFGKALPGIGHLITTEMGSGELTPLGYAAGGPIPQEPEQTGMLSGLMSLIKNIRENAFAPEQREDGGEEYMKIFNFLWKQGYDSQQIDDIINRRVNQEDLVPSHDGSEEFKG